MRVGVVGHASQWTHGPCVRARRRLWGPGTEKKRAVNYRKLHENFDSMCSRVSCSMDKVTITN